MVKLPLEGRVALVTGASRGLGTAIAKRLAADGAEVVVTSRSVDKLDVVVADIVARGGRARATPADLSDLDAIPGVVNAVGAVDILVNNAAAPEEYMSVLQRNDKAWSEAIGTNLLAPLALIRECGLAMAAKGNGSIVNISSIAGHSPAPYLATYAVTKAAINMLTRVAAMELAQSGVRVNAVAPGITTEGKTAELISPELTANIGKVIPTGRFGAAEEISSLVAWLCSDEATYVSGQTYTVDGAMTAGLWTTFQVMAGQ